MFQSIVQPRGSVAFPDFLAERVYMRAFTQAEGLPADLARWQPTVDAMLEGIEAPGPIYLMVDQGVVPAGQPQRRPGIHIDGYWVPALSAHRTPEEKRHYIPGVHDTRPRRTPSGGHQIPSGRHMSVGRHDEHRVGGVMPTEAIILASNVSACRALVGTFDGPIGKGGDCAHLDLSALDQVILDAGRVYAGNVTMLHESLPVPATVERTLVRLNVPGWSPK